MKGTKNVGEFNPVNDFRESRSQDEAISELDETEAPKDKILEEPVSRDVDLLGLRDTSNSTILSYMKDLYLEKNIYFSISELFISINPFETLDIYDDSYMQKYHNGSIEDLPAHIYKVAEMALRNLGSTKNKLCTIILKGESGSGKTQASRYILKYLSGVRSIKGDAKLIEHQVPESNTIIESFGNAMTGLNNDSSRFSNVTHIHLNEQMNIVGASQESYMLEKSRVTTRSNSEKNYHIFYMILNGANEKLREKYHLENVEYYNYLRGDYKSDIDTDIRRFDNLSMAMAIFESKGHLLDFCMSLISAILRIGNIKFLGDENKSSVEIAERNDLMIAAKLLGVNEDLLEDTLCRNTIVINMAGKNKKNVTEETKVPYTMSQAYAFRDSLSKTLYNELFESIIAAINKVLLPKCERHYQLSIIDSFGFEVFSKNSFEQLCINHANERINYEFTCSTINQELQVFKDEFDVEIKVSVPDPKPYMELMQGDGKGIFPTIDEYCRLSQSNSNSLVSKIRDNLSKHPLYTHSIKEEFSFKIKHYAQEVAYDASEFLEKSKINIQKSILDLVKSSKLPYFKNFFQQKTDCTKLNSRKVFSSGLQLCRNLNELMKHIESSKSYYVNFMKPNKSALPFTWDDSTVETQLVYNGIPYFLLIRREILPVKLSFQQFIARYYSISPFGFRVAHRDDPKLIASKIIETLGLVENSSIGRTLIFMSNENEEKIDMLCHKLLANSAISIQKNYRTHLAIKCYRHTLNAIVIIQTIYRGSRVRISYNLLKNAVILIQTVWRGVMSRRRFKIFQEEIENEKRLLLMNSAKKGNASALQNQTQENVDDTDISRHCTVISQTTIFDTGRPYKPPIIQAIPRSYTSRSKRSVNHDDIANESRNVMNVISDALVSSRQSDTTSRYCSYKSKTFTINIGSGKECMSELLSVDISDIDYNSLKCQMITYAKTHYNHDKSDLRKKDTRLDNWSSVPTLQDLLTPTKCPISQPMLCSVATDAGLSNIALSCFKNLLKYSDESSRKVSILRDTIMKCWEYPDLIDETYVHHVRQTTNLVPESGKLQIPLKKIEGYWISFHSICNSFPPSRTLFKFVVTHFLQCKKSYMKLPDRLKNIRGAPGNCLLVMRKLYSLGMRKVPLSLSELTQIQNYTRETINVLFLCGDSVPCSIYPHSRSDEVLHFAMTSIGHRNIPRWGLKVSYGETTMCIPQSGYIYDYIYKAVESSVKFVPKKNTQILDACRAKICAVRTVFTKDVPELVSEVLSKSLILQIGKLLDGASFFIDREVFCTLAALSMCMMYRHKSDPVNREEFESKVEANVPAWMLKENRNSIVKTISSACSVYHTLRREALWRQYLITALSQPNIDVYSISGLYGDDKIPCIIHASSGGVVVVNSTNQEVFRNIASKSIYHYEHGESHIRILSVVEEADSANLTRNNLDIITIWCNDVDGVVKRINGCTAVGSGGKKIRSKSESDIEALNAVVMKCRRAVSDANLVRSYTSDELAQYEQERKSQYKAKRKKNGSTQKDAGIAVINYNVNECKYPNEGAEQEPKQMIPCNSIIWNYWSFGITKSLTTGRVPTTWAKELWSYINYTEGPKCWTKDSVENLFDLIFGAPQHYVDEIYIQLAKAIHYSPNSQTTNNPMLLQNIWTTLYIVSCYFTPSPLILAYIRAQVKLIYAQHANSDIIGSMSWIHRCVSKLKENLVDTIPNQRLHRPSELELNYVIYNLDIVVSVFTFFPEEDVKIKIKPKTTFAKLFRDTLDRCSLKNKDPNLVYTMQVFSDGAWDIIDANRFVCDKIAENYNEQLQNTEKPSSKAIFGLRLTYCNMSVNRIPDLYDRCYFSRQIISDVVTGILPVPTCIDFVRIASCFAQFERGNFKVKDKVEVYEEYLKKYIPKSYAIEHNVEALDIRNSHMSLTCLTESQLSIEIYNIISKWNLHNFTMFSMEHKSKTHINRKCILAVNHEQILVDPDPDGNECDSIIRIESIKSIVVSGETVLLIYSSQNGSIKCIFNGERAFYFYKIIKTYQNQWTGTATSYE